MYHLTSVCDQFLLTFDLAIFQNTILNSYGTLIKFLPLSLADRSYSRRVEARSEEAPTKVDALSPILSGELEAVDFANTSASGSSQCPGEGESPNSGVAESHSLERAPSPIFSK